MSRAAAPLQVRTPGEQPAEGETDMDALAAAAPDLDAADTKARGKKPAGDTVTMSKADLEQMLARAVAQGAAMSNAPQRKVEDNLPDQSEIDPAKIKRPTLSKQGFVVPLGYGEPADVSIKR